MAEGSNLGLSVRGHPTDRGHRTGRPRLTDRRRGLPSTGRCLVLAWVRDAQRASQKTGRRWAPVKGKWSPPNSGEKGWNRIPNCTVLTARSSCNMSENTAQSGKVSSRAEMEAGIRSRISASVRYPLSKTNISLMSIITRVTIHASDSEEWLVYFQRKGVSDCSLLKHNKTVMATSWKAWPIPMPVGNLEGVVWSFAFFLASVVVLTPGSACRAREHNNLPIKTERVW